MVKRILTFHILVLANLLLTNSSYAYTEKEYAIYQEAMNTPVSISEKESYKLISKKYKISAEEVETTVEKVMGEIYAGGSQSSEERKQKIKTTLSKITKVKNIIVSGDFANVSYIHNETAWDIKDVKNKVLKSMPKILQAIFTIQGIERARLTVFFPSIGGGEKKVAIVECGKADFNINKSVNEYALTVYPLR